MKTKIRLSLPIVAVLLYSVLPSFGAGIGDYKIVEWLEGNGSQSFDAGIAPTATTVSQLKFIYRTAGGPIFYGANGTGSTGCGYRLFYYDGGTCFDYELSTTNNKRISGGGIITLGETYEYEMGNYYVKDLSTGANVLAGSIQPDPHVDGNLYLFGPQAYGRLYYLKVYADDLSVNRVAPQLDLVPVVSRTSPDDVCLMDLNTGELIRDANASATPCTCGEAVKMIVVAPIDPVPYVESQSCEPAVVVYDNETGLVVDSANYEVAYLHNGHPGLATVVVTGKNAYEGMVGRRNFTIVGEGKRVFFVCPSATGDGSGYDWFNAATNIPRSSSDVPSDVDEVWVATNELRGVTVNYSRPLVIRGGFVGTENSASERLPGLVTVINGHGEDECCCLQQSTADVEFDRFEFTQAAKRGVTFPDTLGAVQMTFRDCRFTRNGPTWDTPTTDGGRAIRVVNGGSKATLVLTNCLVAGNCRLVKGPSADNSTGHAAVWVESLAKLVARDCVFATNGVPLSFPHGADYIVGGSSGASALEVASSGFDLENCVFVGNRVQLLPKGWNGNAAVAGLNVASAAEIARVDHCRFVGNTGDEVLPNFHTDIGGGAINLTDGSGGTVPVEISHCTFGYNFFYAQEMSAGLTIQSGNVRVRNCIFFGNRLLDSTKMGCDIRLRGGTLDLDYSLLTTAAANPRQNTSVYAATPDSLTLGDHMLYGDPRFVTSVEEFESCLGPFTLSGGGTSVNFKSDAETVAKVMGFDVHAAAGNAPTIDTGDPESAWDLEPDPNGERVNLGVYGNTPEAHVTPKAQPTIVGGQLELLFPFKTTQPRLRFELGGDEGGEYSATATLQWTTNGTDWTQCWSASALCNGFVYDQALNCAFDSGSALTFRLTVSSYGAEDVTATAEVLSIPWPKPASYGKGGGDGVYHVRPGATGDGSGCDWFNAAAVLPLSADDIPGDVREIWVATNELRGVTVNFSRPLVIRGGFVGTENAAHERLPGLVTVINGCNEDECCCQQRSTADVEFDRFEFTQAAKRGVTFPDTLGAVQMTFRDCRFTRNGPAWDTPRADGGRAIRVVNGGSKATLVLTNCLVAGNCRLVKGPSADNSTGHAAVWVESLAKLVARDCVFATNGVPLSFPHGADYIVGGSSGASALEVASSGFDLENCVFVGNRVQLLPKGYNGNAAVAGLNVASAAEIARVDHCRFVGNTGDEVLPNFHTDIGGGAINLTDRSGGTVPVEISNCTIAYNTFYAQEMSAGLTIQSGNARVRNCIFFGNRLMDSTKVGCDIRLRGGTLDLDYSLLTLADADNPRQNKSAYAATPDNLTLGDHMQYGDPRFVTSVEEFESCLGPFTLSGGGTSVNFKSDAETVAKVMGFDVHVTSRKSPAVDTGDPDSDFSKEPMPNGKRINLGAYGNTPYATTRGRGMMLHLK